jgi:hypothetical protein
MHDDDGLDREQAHEPRRKTLPGGIDRPEWLASLGPLAMVGIFLVGVVTSVILGLAWVAFTGDDREQGSADGANPTSGNGLPDPDGFATGAEAPADRPAANRLSRCASAVQVLDGTLGAARPALDQWAVHVGAMNKLVVGEITLQQATEFWERTRLGAQRAVEGFRDAMSTLRRRGLDCPSPELLGRGARALPGCARQVEAEVRVLRTAGTAIDTWEHHVHQMDMLRLGEITPEEATRMWLSMWQQGVRDLDAYRSADRDARRLDGCSLVGPSS